MFQLKTFLVTLTLVFQVSALAQKLAGPIDFFYAPKPDAHQPVIDAINASKQSVKMVMFHLSDPAVGSALMSAAKRGIDVRVIFDKSEWRSPKDQSLVADMKTAGVKAVQATAAFRITHEKAMVIDDQRAMISTMNQVKTFMGMFDMGIFTTDKDVIAEWNKVFEADWQNAADGGSITPPLTNANLLWSPINSIDRLVALIGGAHHRIELTVENLSEEHIQNALFDAASRGVAVRVIVPQCDVVKANFNYPAVMALRLAKVDARMMPGPASTNTPYIHAKAIVADQNVVYMGSENFSYSSLTLSREVGIIAEDSDLATKVDLLFEDLWQKSNMPPADPNYKCAAFDVGTKSPAPDSDAGSGSASGTSVSGTNWLDRLMIQPSLH